MARQSILLMEDDQLLGETIKELLESDGYAVEWVIDGEVAAECTYASVYALYIFDINVPEINGFELLEGLRSASDKTPAIFISALVDLESISKGFKIGADDYIKKPFFPEELLIRVNAKIGQSEAAISYGDISYDPKSRIVRKVGAILALGEVQFALLDLFMRCQNQVVDKDDLLECLEQPSSAGLRVAINKLKQTTGLDIKNIRGVGYTLDAR